MPQVFPTLTMLVFLIFLFNFFFFYVNFFLIFPKISSLSLKKSNFFFKLNNKVLW